jgi:hypothetical protein
MALRTSGGEATSATLSGAARSTIPAMTSTTSTSARQQKVVQQAADAEPLSAAAVTGGSSARSAAALANMFGVVTVTSTKKGTWGERPLVKARLEELGVRHIRNRIFTGNKGQIAFLRELAASGIRLNAVMGDPTMKGGTPEQLVTLVADQLPGVCSSLEGANEWNLQGGSNWVSELRSHQTRLYRAAKGKTKTRNIPVVGPALGMRKGYDELGNLSSFLDRGNIHLYTGGYVPGYRSDEQLRLERIVAGSKPVFVTETGWHNAIHTNATHHYTSEAAAGIYAPRLLLEYFIRNVPRVFIYELVDDRPDASMTNHEAHFGLLRNDFSRKPAFNALKNFMALLDHPATAGTAQAKVSSQLAFATAKAPSDLKRVLVQRADGTFVLFLWRDVSIWDPRAERPLSVKPAAVEVTLETRSTVKAYRPSSSNRAFSQVKSAAGTSMAIGAEVVAVEITPS